MAANIRLPAFGLLVVAFASLAAACGGGSEDPLVTASFSESDLPADWQAAEFGNEGEGLWELLPELLTVDSEARIVIRAFEDESGTNGVATLFIEVEEPEAVPQVSRSGSDLGPLARLLNEQDALLGPTVDAGDPGSYFATSDEPVAGSLRSRLVRLRDDDRLFSDSLVFAEGNVLAVVTVWYPELEGPAVDLDDIALGVLERLTEE